MSKKERPHFYFMHFSAIFLLFEGEKITVHLDLNKDFQNKILLFQNQEFNACTQKKKTISTHAQSVTRPAHKSEDIGDVLRHIFCAGYVPGPLDPAWYCIASMFTVQSMWHIKISMRCVLVGQGEITAICS